MNIQKIITHGMFLALIWTANIAAPTFGWGDVANQIDYLEEQCASEQALLNGCISGQQRRGLQALMYAAQRSIVTTKLEWMRGARSNGVVFTPEDLAEEYALEQRCADYDLADLWSEDEE